MSATGSKDMVINNGEEDEENVHLTEHDEESPTSTSPTNEDQLLQEQQQQKYDFDEACHFAIEFGRAAYKYGSQGSNVELYVVTLLQSLGYNSTCALTQSELLLCAYPERYPYHPRMWLVEAKSGSDMDKLSGLAELAKKILSPTNSHRKLQESDEQSDETTFTRLTLHEALHKLEQISVAADPYGTGLSCLSWMLVGFSLPPLLGASWYDVVLSTFLGLINFWIAYGLAALKASKSRFASISDWDNLIMAFIPSLITSACKVWWTTTINTAIVVLGAVAIPLPGYTISLGIIELCFNRITSGFGHLLQGIVVLLWLALGTSLGIAIIHAIQEPQPLSEDVVLIDSLWQILMVPIICLCLAIAFQNSYRDIGWSVACQGFSYAMSYVGSLSSRPYIGSFLGALAFTLFANLWALWYNRPNTVLLVPAFVLSVSGSVGFRGLLNLSLGEQELGMEQFWRMIIIALVTMVGILAGSALIKPTTTL